MKKLVLLCLVCAVAFFSNAQLLSWTPEFPKDNSTVVITMDATYGNQGLNNFGNPNDVYVHIGVITNLSANADDWKYVPFAWATTPANGKATFLGNNKYSYTINNIRSFFNVPASETILRVAILFRSGNGNSVQRNGDGSNMYVQVYDNNLAARFTVPFLQPKYNLVPETITKTVGDNLNMTGIASQSSAMKLYLNGTVVQTATAAVSIMANPVLNQAGNNEIVLEATAGAVTRKDTIRFFVSGNVTVAPLPAGVRDGINYNANNTEATLVLYAPNKNRVCVIGEFAGSNWSENANFQMNKTPDGNYWWKTITGLTPGTEYAFQYLVDGTLKIAEPYAEKILDPYNNNDQNIPAATYPSLRAYPAGQTGIVSLLQTNSPSYNWQVNNFARPDKRNLVIYELLVRDFIAAHDWKTLRDTLSYLKRLGINAIEIMPFNEFEGNESWGYNPDFYFAPDKYYGPKNTLKEFIDTCHKNGIAVIMDMVLNHSFGLSPMVQLYWDGANNRPAANNPWFNPVPKHAYNVGFDMNHESMATRYFSSRVMEYWLKEYKIDGYRFDLSKGFTQNQTCDNNGANCNEGAMANYDASRVAIWKRYYDTCQLKANGSYVILEHFAVDQEEIELSNYGMLLWGNLNYQFNEATMGWIPNSNFERALYNVRNWTRPYLVGFMESHDEERLTQKNINFGNAAGSYNTRDTTTSLQRNGMAAAFLLGMPGPKMIWQFGEVGYDYSINYCISNGTIANECRTYPKPIRWDYKTQARRQSLFDVYAKMNKLRFNALYKDVFIANNTQIDRSLGGGFKWLKVRSANDSSDLVIIGNFDVTTQTGSVTFPVAGTWYDHLTGNTITTTTSAQSITLAPGEYHVYINRNLNASNPGPVDPGPTNPPASALQANFFPNPGRNNSVLKINVPQAGRLDIGLWNISGSKLMNIYAGNANAGEQTITMGPKVVGLPEGIYILKVETGTELKVIKISVR